MSSVKPSVRTSCRVCGFKKLSPILSLGDLHVSDFVDGSEEAAPKHPLELVLCNEQAGGCGLLQLRHTVPHEAMYRNYWYRSGMNKTMTTELHGIASVMEKIAVVKSGDTVIDIGANDGTLLRGYGVTGITRVGFEPAKNLMQYNREGGLEIINDFFNFAAWKKKYGVKAKAKAITAIAMFYDLEDPNAFVSDVKKCLDKDGVFVVQMSYLPLMLSENAFDNICHEHLEYYSLLSLEHLFNRNGMEIFDVVLNEINGGSFRVYARHAKGGKGVSVPVGAQIRLESLRLYEKGLGLGKRAVYMAFAERIKNIGAKISAFIKKELKKGKKVHVYGASTKGNTLLQFYGLDSRHIAAAAERNPDKWGKKTVGTLIPIISEEQARKEKPDYFLVLPWHFMPEFKVREAAYLKAGGKFIVPLPEFKVVDHES